MLTENNEGSNTCPIPSIIVNKFRGSYFQLNTNYLKFFTELALTLCQLKTSSFCLIKLTHPLSVGESWDISELFANLVTVFSPICWVRASGNIEAKKIKLWILDLKGSGIALRSKTSLQGLTKQLAHHYTEHIFTVQSVLLLK